MSIKNNSDTEQLQYKGKLQTEIIIYGYIYIYA